MHAWGMKIHVLQSYDQISAASSWFMLVGTVLCFKLVKSIQMCSLLFSPLLDKALIFFFSELQCKSSFLRGILVVKDPGQHSKGLKLNLVADQKWWSFCQHLPSELSDWCHVDFA